LLIFRNGGSIWLQMLTAQNSKKLQTTQAQLQEISYAQEHNQETSYAQTQLQETSIQIELQRKCLRLNTWYTISGVHRYKLDKTLKTLEFLRYESC